MRFVRSAFQGASRLAFLIAVMGLAGLDVVVHAGEVYVQTNLVSDMSGVAQATDPNLKDAWGMSFSKTSPFWISAQAGNINGMSYSTIDRVNGQNGTTTVIPATIGVPNLNGAAHDPGANGPTGQVNTNAPGITTGANDFLINGAKAGFIFANLDGSISGWTGGASATIMASVSGASLTGLAIANDSKGASFLYAADQNSGNIYMFNSSWKMVGTLKDPNGLPAGYTAFNVQNIGGMIYATYGSQSTQTGGIVDVYKPDGTFVARRIDDQAGLWLQLPWGLTVAPKSFGQFGGDLLVGNNGANGWINAFDPNNGNFLGTLTLSSGQPFNEGNLWALSFGNDKGAGSSSTLYFAAGITETDGLFGQIASVPEPSSVLLGLIAVGMGAAYAKVRSRKRARAA
jgi:uncharacterized protein (TIGR03118 family)